MQDGIYLNGPDLDGDYQLHFVKDDHHAPYYNPGRKMMGTPSLPAHHVEWTRIADLPGEPHARVVDLSIAGRPVLDPSLTADFGATVVVGPLAASGSVMFIDLAGKPTLTDLARGTRRTISGQQGSGRDAGDL